MKVIKGTSLQFIPASHEDQKEPGAWKKILFTRADLSDGSVQMINWAKLPAGKAFRAHYHEDMEEVFIIINGKVSITINKETETLKAGDAVQIPIKATHHMSNTSNEDVNYIVIGITKEGKGKTIVV